MNEQTLLTKLGFSTHSAIPNSIISDEWDRYATCAKCGLDISAFWLDDPDRLSGWSAWKSLSGSCQA
jgi:hypothetical protein